jgi:hypothetical protein
MMASRQRYRLLASLVGFALALLYPLVAAGNARADDPNPAMIPAVNSALQAADDATGAGDVSLASGEQPSDVPAPVDESVTAATSQQASTEQAANSAAAASQQQPRNLVISIRINSPGNDGPISQTNVAGSVAGASNDGSIGQGGAPEGQAPQQQASTDQAATATATATQEQPQNIVILIRINSPGDNGPISQTNTTVAVSNAGNVSVTSQGGTGSGAADDTTTGATPDPQAAIGPPAQQESPAVAAAGALPRMSVALLAPAAPRTAIATGHRTDRPAQSTGHPTDRPAPAAPTGHRPAPGDRTSSVPSRKTVSTEPSDAAVSSGAREPQSRLKPVQRSATARGDAAVSRDPGAGRRAVDFLGQLAPRSPLQASAGEKDVTNAVMFTLIALFGAFLVFLCSTYGVRLLNPRSWL